jgi:formiminotetrahydrofolate cyclodeaminase
MKKYNTYTLQEYLDALSQRAPVPGGGSAAALTAATGAALISMVAQYSLGKNPSKSVENKIKAILKQSEEIRRQFLELVDRDAEAYLKVVKVRSRSIQIRKRAAKAASDVPLKVCRLCHKAVELTPYLVENGNRYLISDAEAAVELLLAAFNAARVILETNR